MIDLKANSERVALVVAIGLALAVGGGAIPLMELIMPPIAAQPDPASLAFAVSQHCDPSRTAVFVGADLDKAVTCRDLDAQQSMAASTRSLVWLGVVQIIVSILGAIGVVWTVWVALKSMEVTQSALLHQQTISQLELRPTMTPLPLVIKPYRSTGLRITFGFINKGGSTARGYQNGWTWKVVPLQNGQSQLDHDTLRLKDEVFEIVKLGESSFSIHLSAREVADVRAGTHCLQMAIIAIYDDAFGGKYRIRYGREFRGADFDHVRRIDGVTFDDPALAGRET